MKRARLINRYHVRRTALDMAAAVRLVSGAPRFTRVSAGFIDLIESSTRAAIAHHVAAAGRKGRTL